MTKEEIFINHTQGHFVLNSNIYAAKNDILNAMEEYANLRLSEQKEKHEKEMEEFAEWCEYECWYYVGQSIWTKRISGDIRKVIEKATTTELLTKFKNR